LDYPLENEIRGGPGIGGSSPTLNLLDMDGFDRDVRVGFIRKVLGIVAFQMAMTLSMVVYTSKNDDFTALVRNPATIIFAVILLFLTLSALMCCQLTKTVPTNYILLFFFVSLFFSLLAILKRSIL
jgi:hypothetical protein